MTAIIKTDISNALGLITRETTDTTVALSAVVAGLGEVREASAAWTEVVVDSSVVKGGVIVAGTHHAASPIIHNKKKTLTYVNEHKKN